MEGLGVINIETLIITGCVKVKNKKMKISNIDDRLNQYLETIRWAIEDTNFDNIIFCENSSCKYDFDKFVSGLKFNNKKFEYLTFEGSNLVDKYGIGYGENEIMNYIFNNSENILLSSCFWKITGRLKINNVNDLLKKHRYDENVCLMYYKWIDTRFYKCSIEKYKEYFLDLGEYFNNGFVHYEKIHYKIADENSIKFKGFKRYPKYEGISASLGSKYNISGFMYFVNNIFCIFKLFNIQLIQLLYKKIRRVN